jgi:hypothetical protein
MKIKKSKPMEKQKQNKTKWVLIMTPTCTLASGIQAHHHSHGPLLKDENA